MGRLIATRILRRCSNEESAKQHFEFFLGKLVKRGYNPAQVRKLFSTATAGHNVHHLRMPRYDSHVSKAFLKVRHSNSVNYNHIRHALRKHQHLVGASSITCASVVQKNVFRILYPYMWNRDRARGGRVGSSIF